MPFGKDDWKSPDMGLKTPSREYDGESSEMGLKMPSKVDVNFIRGLFVGILVPDICGGLSWGMWVSVVLLLEKNSMGNRV